MIDDFADSGRTILDRCDEFAQFTEEPDRLTRSYGSPALAAAMARAADWMSEAGLSVRRDAAGNLIGRLAAADPGAPTLLLGSHLDSVRDAGKYDGPLGVLTALAALDRARAQGPFPFHVDVVAFADEEGLRFRTAYLGSRAFAGAFDPALLELTDAAGIALREACLAAGGDPEALAAGVARPERLLGYVEAHIEQGPTLESLDVPVGVVSTIAGQTRVNATFRGEAGHAGTVRMMHRRDALSGAAEFVLAAERQARGKAGLYITVGHLVVSPGASNVIPGEVRLTADVRSANDGVRERALVELRAAATDIASRRRLELDWRVVPGNAAVPMDRELTQRLANAIDACGYPVHHLPSGAGHDAVMLARLCPVAMLFVRCKGGVSHNPAESVSAEDAAATVAVLARFLDDARTSLS
ncbi:MAG: allantoate amidohydrolase [Thermomicrobiales bacterium]|nr:allantoate amidohydrolase [Thermomicrobiales bacterium]